ncbi:MAG: hypothetical protein U1E76_25245 [Planctomycetota bacterium]
MVVPAGDARPARSALLGFFGREVYRQSTAVPDRVVLPDGSVVMTRKTLTGQQAWQSIGGQQLGSIWGHGAYGLPTGRRTGCIARRARCSIAGQREERATTARCRASGRRQARLTDELRRNTFDRVTGAVTISADRRAAIAQVAAHYVRCSAVIQRSPACAEPMPCQR